MAAKLTERWTGVCRNLLLLPGCRRSKSHVVSPLHFTCRVLEVDQCSSHCWCLSQTPQVRRSLAHPCILAVEGELLFSYLCPCLEDRLWLKAATVLLTEIQHWVCVCACVCAPHSHWPPDKTTQPFSPWVGQIS